MQKLTPLEIEKTIRINLTGLILCCKEAKLKKDAHIINISSSSYSRGRKNASIYSSAKAAVVNFTQALSQELPNLKINVVAPGRTNTNMRRDNFKDENINTLLSPSDVAKEVISLLKESSLTSSIVEIKKA